MNTKTKSSVLITGSTSGLGFALAKALASHEDYSVVITGRNKEKLDLALHQLNQGSSTPVTGYQYEQASRNNIDMLIAGLTKDNCLPAILIANIGINPSHHAGFHKIHRSDYSVIQETLTSNVLNTIYLVMQCIPWMQKNGGGKIVLIGSQAYQYGLVGQVAYNVSKSALVGLYNSINKEYKQIQAYLFDLGVIDNARNSLFREKLMNNPLVTLLDEDDVAATIIADITGTSTGLKRNIP